MENFFVKTFTNQEEQDNYYSELESEAIKIMSYPVLLDKYDTLVENSKFLIVSDDDGYRFFIKEKEDSQQVNTLKESMKFMKNSGNRSFMYSVGTMKKPDNTSLIIYDYYSKNYYDVLSTFYHRNNHTMILNTIIRILIEIHHLDKAGICHFDLHLRNILYNESDRKSWKYTTDRGEFTFQNTNYELVIGDFGLSLLRTSEYYLEEVEYFYKNFFPIFYYSQKSKGIYSQINHEFIDVWRFLRTILNILPNYPYPEIRKTIDYLKMYCSTAEKTLCSNVKKNVSAFCLDLAEVIMYELERVRS